MTKQTNKPDQKPKPTKPDMSAMMMTSNSAAAKVWTAMMTETTRFLTQRLTDDLETQKAMLNCKHPAEIVQLQSEFFRKSVEQYTAEAHRMFEIMTSATEEAVKETGAGTKRGYNDIPL